MAPAAHPAAAAPRLGNLLAHLAPTGAGSRGLPTRNQPGRNPLRPRPSIARGGRPTHLPDGSVFEYWERPWTTRPELRGTFGVVASEEHLASAAGMRALELGGNAFDAAVVAGLSLWHTVPGSNGPGGECSITLFSPSDGGGGGGLQQICGQGNMPMAATREKFADLGLSKMPGGGTLLSACTPGAFDAYMVLLATHGTFTARQACESLLSYAKAGVPTSPSVHNSLGWSAGRFVEHWPTSAAVFLDETGCPPRRGGKWRNPRLAATFERLLAEAEAAGAAASWHAEGSEERRQAEIAAMRRVWSTGFVAEAIVEHCKHEFWNERQKMMQVAATPLAVGDLHAIVAVTNVVWFVR
eukprot:SAG22_NODE_860_length_6828_cov_5.663100_3_plen_355_part_00